MKKQLALCIGNDDYKYSCLSKLKCAVNDANAIAEKLIKLNFDVIVQSNLDRKGMHEAVDDFENRLSEYDVALFYFAGHGFECNGKNLLMPVDLEAGDNGYREWMALQLDTVIAALEGKHNTNNLQTKIIILDACRQNPEARGDSARGFAPIFAPSGTIIAFSTSPGQLSLEAGDHGLYTQALLSSIDIPRIPVENMFKHVREILIANSSGRQVSWEHTSLIGNYFFNEDRIDGFSSYTPDALADNNYYFNPSNEIGNVVAKLKSYNYYIQNEAIRLIPALEFTSASANDIFVLGRNIYQAADGGAWDAGQFIKKLSAFGTIPDEAKIHLLSGMAYEIYFNSYGVLREKLKTACYLEILKHLENERYQMAKNFIVEKIRAESDLIIYQPCSEERIELHLCCAEIEKRDGDVIYKIYRIYFQGKNILYTQDGTEEMDADDFNWYVTSSLPDIKRTLSERLVAPPDMLIFTYDLEMKDNYYLVLPNDFSLRYRKKID